jgi:co-chaperonin GroES (HSP10)
MITPVNGYFLVEPVLRTELENKELKARMEKSGLIMPDNANQPDNRNKFEGVPNQGYVRYLPEAYKGGIKVGMHIVFDEDKPNGVKHDDITLFALKEDQIVAVILEDE